MLLIGLEFSRLTPSLRISMQAPQRQESAWVRYTLLLEGDATAVIGCWTWVKRVFILPILLTLIYLPPRPKCRTAL